MEILSSGGKYRLSTTKQKYEGDYPPSLKLTLSGVVLNHCMSKSKFVNYVPAGTPTQNCFDC